MQGSHPVFRPSDISRIDVTLSDDVNYWTRNLGVSEALLRAAVTQVGVMSNQVRTELRRHRAAKETAKVIRIFIFYPSINHRDFWVLLPGSRQHTFSTEGAAVAFALEQAKALRGSGRAIEVMQEKITGTWMRLPA